LGENKSITIGGWDNIESWLDPNIGSFKESDFTFNGNTIVTVDGASVGRQYNTSTNILEITVSESSISTGQEISLTINNGETDNFWRTDVDNESFTFTAKRSDSQSSENFTITCNSSND